MTEIVVGIALLVTGYWVSKQYTNDDGQLLINKNDLNNTSNRSIEVKNNDQVLSKARFDAFNQSKKTGVVGPNYLQSQITGEEIPIENFHNNMNPTNNKGNCTSISNVSEDYSNRTLENFTGQQNPDYLPQKAEQKPLFKANQDANTFDLSKSNDYANDIQKNFSQPSTYNEKNGLIPFEPVKVPKGLGFGQNQQGFSGYQQPNVLDYLTESTPNIDQIRPQSQQKADGILPDIQQDVNQANPDQFKQALTPQIFTNNQQQLQIKDQFQTKQPNTLVQQTYQNQPSISLQKQKYETQQFFGTPYAPNDQLIIKQTKPTIRKKNQQTYPTPSMNIDQQNQNNILNDDFGQGAQQVYNNQRSSMWDNSMNIPNPQDQNRQFALNPDDQPLANTSSLFSKKSFNQVNPRLYGNAQDDNIGQGNLKSYDDYIQTLDDQFYQNQNPKTTNREAFSQKSANSQQCQFASPMISQPSSLFNNSVNVKPTMKETNQYENFGNVTGQQKIKQSPQYNQYCQRPQDISNIEYNPNPYNQSTLNSNYYDKSEQTKQSNNFPHSMHFGQPHNQQKLGNLNQKINFNANKNNKLISSGYGLNQKSQQNQYVDTYNTSQFQDKNRLKQQIGQYQRSNLNPPEKSYNQSVPVNTFKQSYQQNSTSDLDPAYAIPFKQNPYFPNSVKKIVSH